jgi:hypothetical protein
MAAAYDMRDGVDRKVERNERERKRPGSFHTPGPLDRAPVTRLGSALRDLRVRALRASRARSIRTVRQIPVSHREGGCHRDEVKHPVTSRMAH